MLKRPGNRIWPALLLIALVGAPHPEADAQEYPTQALMTWEYQNNMAWHAFNRGDYNVAELRFNTAIKTLRKYKTSNQRLLARSYYDLTRVLYAQKRYAEAEPLAEWVLKVRESDSQTRDDTLFDSVYLLAIIHREQGENSEAAPLLRRALEIEERNVGPDDPRPALTLKELADIVYRLKKYEEAEALYRRAIAVQRHYDSELNPALAEALEGLADVLNRLSRTAEARDAEAEARRIRDAAREAAEAAKRAAAARALRNSFKPTPVEPPAP